MQSPQGPCEESARRGPEESRVPPTSGHPVRMGMPQAWVLSLLLVLLPRTWGAGKRPPHDVLALLGTSLWIAFLSNTLDSLRVPVPVHLSLSLSASLRPPPSVRSLPLRLSPVFRCPRLTDAPFPLHRDPPPTAVSPDSCVQPIQGGSLLLGHRLAGASAVSELQQPAAGGCALRGLDVGKPNVLVLGEGDCGPEKQRTALLGGHQNPGRPPY